MRCWVRGPAAASGRRKSCVLCVEETAVAPIRRSQTNRLRKYFLIHFILRREKPKKGFIMIKCATAIPFVHIVTCVRIWVTLGIRLPYLCINIQKYTIGEKKKQTNGQIERARGYTLHYKDTPVRLREYMTGLQIIGVWKLLDFLRERRSYRFS